ncbi:MAG: NAD(P)-dependent oxidoreductase, partial [Actinomycetes bacterium]
MAGGTAPEPAVLVTSRSFSSGALDLAAELEAAGLTVRRGPADHDLRLLRPLLAGSVAWIAGTGPVTAAHLSAAPRLRVLARYGVGVDAVDLAAATACGVTVTNTPGANTAAVADHTLALMLAALRSVVVGDRRVRAGDWRGWRARELGDLTVGIVGVGRIGRLVARRLAGFGCALRGHDPGVPAEELRRLAIEPAGLLELASGCDLVTLHSPGGGCVVDAAWLGAARPGLVLVNTARANLVDEAALAAALHAGRVAAYAADTVSGEGQGTASSPLLDPALAEVTVLTPHVAAQTMGAVDKMG